MDGFVKKGLARGKTRAYFVSPSVKAYATLDLHKSYIMTVDPLILGKDPVLKYSFFL